MIQPTRHNFLNLLRARGEQLAEAVNRFPNMSPRKAALSLNIFEKSGWFPGMTPAKEFREPLKRNGMDIDVEGYVPRILQADLSNNVTLLHNIFYLIEDDKVTSIPIPLPNEIFKVNPLSNNLNLLPLSSMHLFLLANRNEELFFSRSAHEDCTIIGILNLNRKPEYIDRRIVFDLNLFFQSEQRALYNYKTTDNLPLKKGGRGASFSPLFSSEGRQRGYLLEFAHTIKLRPSWQDMHKGNANAIFLATQYGDRLFLVHEGETFDLNSLGISTPFLSAFLYASTNSTVLSFSGYSNQGGQLQVRNFETDKGRLDLTNADEINLPIESPSLFLNIHAYRRLLPRGELEDVLLFGGEIYGNSNTFFVIVIEPLKPRKFITKEQLRELIYSDIPLYEP